MKLLLGTGQPLGRGRMHPAGSVRDADLATLVDSYKTSVAGAYMTIPPGAIAATVPSGKHILSTKVDGEQWFLYKNGHGSVLLSPNGKAITGVPVTDEADTVLAGWSGLLAGELHVTLSGSRPHVFDLHRALGGGSRAEVDRLRFAAFDLLRDGSMECMPMPFDQRAARVRALLMAGTNVHAVDFTEVSTPEEVAAAFHDRVQAGEEGVVLRCADGRAFKIKPRVTIDAAVVAYTETPSGVGELLLGLMPDAQGGDGRHLQLIGRVDTGFSRQERRALADRLKPLQCESSLHIASRGGRPYCWVRPELVVETVCHEVLTVNSDSETIRRWRVQHDDGGWRPLGKAPSVSLRDAVFVRMREDKTVTLPDVRWGQVAAFAPVESAAPIELPASTILRREAYAKNVRGGGLAIRKLVVWKTNKEDSDPRYPAYAAAFTDYSPARQEVMATDLRVASSLECITSTAERWLAEHIRRGWKCVAKTGDSVATSASESYTPPPRASTHALTVAFARSTSPTFPIVRRRLDALAELGALNVTTDDSGKEVWFELSVTAGLVENYRRIANILNLVRRWKSTEIALNNEPLDRFACDSVMNRLDEIRQCWTRRKASGPAGCRRDCVLGCRCLNILPSQRFLEGAFVTEPQWYTVGRFERGQVVLDKAALAAQVNRRRNRLLETCPNFDAAAVAAAIEVLPATLSPDDAGYRLVYARDNGVAAWVWPEHAPLPPRLAERGVEQRAESSPGTGLSLVPPSVPALTPPARLARATYADVRGQDAAVEAVGDLIELPMKHAAMFEAVGATAKPSGVILAGPPGTGKTLLARAVAGECGAHLEIVSGPELLNPYVGATEQALRDVFDRARQKAPSLILFDELDGLAPSRADADAHHQRSVVAQLLALLDGLQSRAGIFVLATTNRPRAIDPALRRPGRFDRVVWMKRPDAKGRADILAHYLKPLRLSDGLNPATLAADLATATPGASGADLENLCQTAARICVKEAVEIGADTPPTITHHHFQQALRELLPHRSPAGLSSRLQVTATSGRGISAARPSDNFVSL